MVVMAINLAVILIVFAGPRIKFIFQHFDKSYKEVTETSGPADLPNQYALSYKVANELQKKVERGRPLVISMSSHQGLIRSVMVQILFRHNLIFSDDFDYKQKIKNIHNAYAINYNDEKNGLCVETNAEKLGDTDFLLCNVD